MRLPASLGLLVIRIGLLFELSASQASPRLENVGYSLFGYNIFQGNPQCTSAGVDPGFTTLIYRLNFSGQTTDDGRHTIPDHTTFTADVGCTTDFSSKVTFKKSDYQQSLAVAASADFEGYGASFSASTDYQHFEQHTSTAKLKMVSSTAECTVYAGGKDAYAPPQLTDNFLAGMNGLPSSYGTGEEYFRFIDVFGTHVVSKATMGARFGFTSFLDETSSTTIEKTGISVGVAASYEGVVKVGGSLNSSSQRAAEEEFSKASQYERIITLGAKPTSTNALEWAKTVDVEPMPIRYKLDPIWTVLTRAEVVANFRMALGEYCEKHLKPKQVVTRCDAPGDGSLDCLWDDDCSDSPGFESHCESHKCVTSPLKREIVSGSTVFLKHVGSGMYFKDVEAAGTRKGWPNGRLGEPKGKFKLLPEDASGPIKQNSKLRIQSETTTSAGYDFLYSAAAGGIYFDEDTASNDKQWWTVEFGTNTLHDGDIVSFENKYYPNSFMQKYEEDWVYCLGGKDSWQIQLADSAMLPAELYV